MSSRSSFPRNEMVYHFTLQPEGEKVLPYLPRSYYLSIKKPNAEPQLSKHEHASKGSFLFWEVYSLRELHWQNTVQHTVGSCLCLVDKFMNYYYHTGIQAWRPYAQKHVWGHQLPRRPGLTVLNFLLGEILLYTGIAFSSLKLGVNLGYGHTVPHHHWGKSKVRIGPLLFHKEFQGICYHLGAKDCAP